MTEPIGHCSECGAEAFDDGDGIVCRCACVAPLYYPPVVSEADYRAYVSSFAPGGARHSGGD